MGAVAITDFIGFGVYDLRYRILDASSASSWSHAVDSGVLAAGAVVCAMGAWRAREDRAVWILAACIIAFFFADEVSGLHTHIDASSLGKLVYVPVLLVLMYCVWRLTAGTAGSGLLRACAALLIVSYAIHVLGPHVVSILGWSTHSWAYQVKVALKEGTELAGLLLGLGALYSAASAPRP